MKTKEALVSLGLTEMKADEVMLLESKMLEQAVRFRFTKKDGSMREAVGTLNRDKMVQEDGKLWEPKGTRVMPEQDLFVKYWDCQKLAWRQFNVMSLVSVSV